LLIPCFACWRAGRSSRLAGNVAGAALTLAEADVAELDSIGA
jgi:hypothetical protein